MRSLPSALFNSFFDVLEFKNFDLNGLTLENLGIHICIILYLFAFLDSFKNLFL